MANTSRIAGFRPVKHLNGSPFNGQVNIYFIPSTDATAVYVGDVVKKAGSASTDGTQETVQLAAAGDAVLGVVIGFEPNRDNLNISGQARLASTNRVVYVVDSPDVIFEAETSNGTPAAVDIGLNINHAVGTPDAPSARSGATVDVGTKNTTATLTFKLLGFSSRLDNEVGASAKVLVKINNHQLAASTGSLGV